MSESPYAITVVEPIAITDAMLISTDVEENDYDEFAVETTYGLGDRIIVAAEHVVYESLQAANIGNTPASSPTRWIEVGPTNRWKCFDGSNSTQTVTDGGAAPSIGYWIEPGRAISSVGVLNVSAASSLAIKMTDDTYGEVYSTVVDMSAIPDSPDWWSWFFGERTAPAQFVATDLPAFPGATLSILLSGSSDLAVGVILVGPNRRFSDGVQYGARIGIQDYSRKEVNDFGDTVLVERAFAKRASMTLLLTASEVDRFQLFLAKVRAIPCLWICTSEYQAMTIFGFYKNFEILINYISHADCSLDLEGLT